jgi:diguanylate cyclase (GGDEF)-like protein
MERARSRRAGRPFAVLQLGVPGVLAAGAACGSLFQEIADHRVVEVVQAGVRECDTVVHVDAGEVAVVLPETVAPAAGALALRLTAAVERAFAGGFMGREVVPATTVECREHAGEDGAMLDFIEDQDQDGLTGLAGEGAFRSAVGRELRRASRYGGRMAVALFDLDGFAAVDAALSRTGADRLFREVAALLRAGIRDTDLAARPGEDELALLLPGADRTGALGVAERFRSELQRRLGGLTVSGGVACYPGDVRSPEALLERAVLALYAAKDAGRNRVVAYEGAR